MRECWASLAAKACGNMFVAQIECSEAERTLAAMLVAGAFATFPMVCVCANGASFDRKGHQPIKRIRASTVCRTHTWQYVEDMRDVEEEHDWDIHLQPQQLVLIIKKRMVLKGPSAGAPPQ